MSSVISASFPLGRVKVSEDQLTGPKMAETTDRPTLEQLKAENFRIVSWDGRCAVCLH